ncbi:MAG: iron-containing alcohol dehydrogenase [Treponema sp.]|jgi:alcohol dehydrogenase|nr:iron-containing alcohol dehydrogenase [Treponema sp.]
MDISFKFDPEVHIGADTLSIAGTVAARHGSRIMVVADSELDTQTVNRLKEILEDSGLDVLVFDGIENGSSDGAANPAFAENVVDLTRAAHCDAIISIGGNNTQVIGKMAAVMTPTKITSVELFDGRSFQNKFLPFISIPTEGTNAFSFTEYFVAADPRNKLIKSIQFPGNVYSAVIIDSSLFEFAAGNTASAGAFITEGLFSTIEAYCSSKANFLSDSLLERALALFAKMLRSAAQPGFADNFAQAGFLASFGTALSSPGIGAALAVAINARTPVARPLCSAVLFPVIAQRLVNARPEKMARLAAHLGAPKAAAVADTAQSSVDALRRCLETLKLPATLKEFNIPLDRMTAAAEAARSLDFISNSPWPVSEEDVFNVLKEVF